MGKPVFLLDRYDNCWRWLSGRKDSPWYPSMRIFRQQRSGEWAPVIARVSTALSDIVIASSAPASGGLSLDETSRAADAADENTSPACGREPAPDLIRGRRAKHGG